MSTTQRGVFLGREREISRLRALLGDLVADRGGVVLVEGEPGIGKSALLEIGLADARVRTWWGAAEELGARFPLRALIDCIPADDRADVLGSLRTADTLVPGDPVLAGAERLVAHIERSCAEAPLLLVLDDLHWADEPSLLAWSRLARLAEQMPLLLVAALRPVPPRPEIARLRRVLSGRGAEVFRLGPLAEDQALELAATLLGEERGKQHRQLAAQAGGNPFYIEEIAQSLRRDPAVGAPVSLTAAIDDQLNFLSASAIRTLRTAALLGTEFVVTDLATVTRCAIFDLMPDIEEACAAGVLVDAGTRLRFRHELIRNSLYESVPAGLRAGLHRQAAQALDEAGVAAQRVAEHLVAAPPVMDSWVLDWIVGGSTSLARAAPGVAAELFEFALAEIGQRDPRRVALESGLATVLRRLERLADLERLARDVLSRTTIEPVHRARMTWILGHMLLRACRFEESIALTGEALAAGGSVTGRTWRARLGALHATTLLHVGDDDEAKVVGARALAEGEAVGDAFAVMFALHAMSLEFALDDCAKALDLIDRGLAVPAGDPEAADLRLVLINNRVYALTLLDRMAEADEEIRRSVVVAEQIGTPRLASLRTTSAVQRFFAGQWDDALAESESVRADLEEERPGSPPGVGASGLIALIAGHRDERVVLERILAEMSGLSIIGSITRDHALYLIMAEALAAERDGRPADALARLVTTLEPPYRREMTMRHVLLPWLVRLALAVGDRMTAAAAVAESTADAEVQGLRGKQVAALRCGGLLNRDPAPLAEAVAHYAAVGRPFERAEALEDQAAVLATRGDATAAGRALGETLDGYQALGAAWDIQRAEARLRALGVRRCRQGSRRRPDRGWLALTPTELKVAHLVARGGSNPDIANELFLSSRTVQTHVSHILAKLGARSRSEIAREATRHSVG